MSIKFLKDYGFLVREVKVSNPEEWGGRKSINAQMWYPRKDTVRIAFFAGERKIAYFDLMYGTAILIGIGVRSGSGRLSLKME